MMVRPFRTTPIAWFVAWACLALALPAAAQSEFDVTVYHSLDPAGADPRPGVPPGCDPLAPAAQGGLPIEAAANGSSNILVFTDSLVDFVATPLTTDLTALGNTVTKLISADLPADISIYDVIWIVKSSPITATDQTALVTFVQNGGGLHLGGELSSFDTMNDTIENIANALVVGGALSIGRQGTPSGPYVFNPAATSGITTTPNALTEWFPLAPGEVSAETGLDADNILVSGASSRHVGAAWTSSELLGGAGRLTLLMDWNWLDNETGGPRLPVIENLQHFLSGGGGGGPAFACVLQGGAGEALELWIDGGPAGGSEGENVCQLGAMGGSGDQLCGAALLFQITGPGVFTDFFPDTSEGASIDTVVHNPACTSEEGCDLPPATKQLRLNFVRGAGTPPAGPRKIGTLVVNSGGSTEELPTVVSAFGEAAGANLQVRPVGSAVQPVQIASTDNTVIPEPGALLQLVAGLYGLGLLQRTRSRRRA